MSNMFSVATSRKSSAFRPVSGIFPGGQAVGPIANTYDLNGNPVAAGTPGSCSYDANGNTVSCTPGAGAATPNSTPVSGLTTQVPTSTSGSSSNTAANYGLIAQGLGTTAQTISSVLQGQNQVQIAQLNAANQQYLANLQSQIALSPNNPTLLGQQLQAQLLAQQIAVSSQGNNNTTILIGLGIVALAVVSYVSSMSKSSTSARRNPVVKWNRTGRKQYLSPSHVRRLRGF